MRYYHLFLAILLIGLSACGSSSTATRGSNYPKMYEEKPAVLLIMPPINKTTHVEAKDYFYFIPLFVIGSCNLWNGVQINCSPMEAALYVLSMLCVGFIEELIFRGFLFKAMAKDGIKSAIIVSSITFGLGHIINLVNGAELLPTFLQIIYATAIGFLFTMLFHKGKCLWPCIITHSVVNSLSVIGVESTTTEKIISAVILTAVSLGYTALIYKNKKHCKT